MTAIRAWLDDAGFTVAGVEELLGPVAAAALHREQVTPAIRALAGSRQPLARLVELFLLQRPVPEITLPEPVRDWLVKGGALEQHSGQLRARLELRPYQNGYVVSDFGEAVLGAALPTDHVLGVGGASLTLAGATVRTPVDSVLDLGTGCGVQALHALSHGKRIVATDLSTRALHCARLTVALNDAQEQVDLRQGTLFEPVTGQRFDLIVSNPPFVITPRLSDVPDYTYRDGGQVGDGVVRAVVQQAGDHLNPGGIAQLLGNWELRRGQTVADVVEPWVPEALDAWVIQREVLDPAQYAELWIGDGGLRHGARYRQLYDAWLADFEARGVEQIGLGIITLRAPGPGTRRLRRFQELPHALPHDGQVGVAIAAGLAAHDAIPVDLQQVRLMVAADVTEERFHRPGEADPSVILLRQGGGLQQVHRVSSAVAATVGACDGTLPVGAILDAVAHLTEAAAAEVRAEVEPVLRELVEQGFLTTP